MTKRPTMAAGRSSEQTTGRTSAPTLLAAPDTTPAPPRCPYCDVIAVKANRQDRRRLRRLGHSDVEWLRAHRDDCPQITLDRLPGWHAAGVLRSPFRGAP